MRNQKRMGGSRKGRRLDKHLSCKLKRKQVQCDAAKEGWRFGDMGMRRGQLICWIIGEII